MSREPGIPYRPGLGIDGVLLALAILLPLVGHLYAWPKAGLPDALFLLPNDKTRLAQAAWRFFNRRWWIHAVYSATIAAVYVLMRIRRTRWGWRALVMAVLSLPALWYFHLASYLGGKLLGIAG